MKILFCRSCGDLRKLHIRSERRSTWTRCACGESCGRYLEDGAYAEVRGRSAEILGIDNNDLMAIVRGDRRRRGSWWVMEPGADGVRVRRVA